MASPSPLLSSSTHTTPHSLHTIPSVPASSISTTTGPYSSEAIVSDLDPSPPYTSRKQDRRTPATQAVDTTRSSSTATNTTRTDSSDSSNHCTSLSSPTSTYSTDTPPKPNPNISLPLIVKSSSVLLSSGFEYHPDLFHLGVSPEQWTRLSHEIANVGRLKFGQKVGAISAAAAMESFGAIGTGFLTGRAVARQSVIGNVKKDLKKENGLTALFERWNSGFFAPLGLHMRLDMPKDVHGDDEDKAARKERRKNRTAKERFPFSKAGTEYRSFKLVLSRLGDPDEILSQTSLEELDVCELEADEVVPAPEYMKVENNERKLAETRFYDAPEGKKFARSPTDLFEGPIELESPVVVPVELGSSPRLGH